MHSDRPQPIARTMSIGIVSIISILSMTGLAGCTTAPAIVAPDSAVDLYAGLDDELDFWDEIATRRVVTNNDALHGLLLLASAGDASMAPGDDGSNRPAMVKATSRRAYSPTRTDGGSTGYEKRVQLAVERGWMKSGDPPPMNGAADIGTISMAICEIVDIKGGVTMQLFGPSPRYCTRELLFLEFMPQRTENQAFTGLQFIDLISEAEDYAAELASNASSGTATP